MAALNAVFWHPSLPLRPIRNPLYICIHTAASSFLQRSSVLWENLYNNTIEGLPNLFQPPLRPAWSPRPITSQSQQTVAQPRAALNEYTISYRHQSVVLKVESESARPLRIGLLLILSDHVLRVISFRPLIRKYGINGSAWTALRMNPPLLFGAVTTNEVAGAWTKPLPILARYLLLAKHESYDSRPYW